MLPMYMAQAHPELTDALDAGPLTLAHSGVRLLAANLQAWCCLSRPYMLPVNKPAAAFHRAACCLL